MKKRSAVSSPPRSTAPPACAPRCAACLPPPLPRRQEASRSRVMGSEAGEGERREARRRGGGAPEGGLESEVAVIEERKREALDMVPRGC